MWVFQIAKVGYTIIKDGRVIVYPWKITDFLPVLLLKLDLYMHNWKVDLY